MGGAWQDPTLRPVPSDRIIYCGIDGQDYGIGWMCRELRERKLRATFFGEVFAGLVFGEDDTRRWMGFLLENGQDVQLHTHTNYFYYAELLRSGGPLAFRTDSLADVPSPDRFEMLQRGIELFRRATGYEPAAYRAGSWRGSRALLRDLRRAGIFLDCSYNAALKRASFDGEKLAPNALQRIDGVWEFPITVARQTLPDPAIRGGLRPFDPVSMSYWELRKVLDDAHAAGVSHISAIFHSFSAVKARDSQYSRIKPDRVVRKRFAFLLDYLSANEDRFRVGVIAELARELRDPPPPIAGAIPELGFFHPLGRKAVQAINSAYWI
jgi:hypothetical protein